jgi:hypothetical protein
MFPTFKRNRYFSGKLMSEQDFQDEQDYFRQKHRLHNRFLHGYGVVAGLEVSVSDDPPGTVRVEAGYAIDPAGNDILLPEAQTVAFPERGKKACLIIEWAEQETDFVPVRSSEVEEEMLAATRVEECATLALDTARTGDEQPCSGGGIMLARLKKRGGVWRVDKRFVVRRVAACQ